MPSHNSVIKSLNMRVVALQRQVTAANFDRNMAFQQALVFADALIETVRPSNGVRECPFCKADLGQDEAHAETCVLCTAHTLLNHNRRKP